MKNPIQFTSTRDSTALIPFWQSLIQGMAEDGGLLVPVNFPKLSSKLLSNKKWWSKSAPADLAFEIMKCFVPESDFPHDELRMAVFSALSFAMPLEQVGNSHDYILRLDEGPTASFKDVAARTLAKLMERYAAVHDKNINIVVATSGDTGVAIADAFGDSKRITVTILYPHAGVSEIQEKQMVEVHHKYKNEQSLPIKGNFDNCQDMAKLLQAARTIGINDFREVDAFRKDIEAKLHIKYSDKDIHTLLQTVSSLDLSSANSINIWRLIPQMTQYFSGYASLVKNGAIKVGEKIVFSVPTGNVGHLIAGIYARELGLPISHFVISTNTNNILANVIGEGIVRHRTFSPSSAPSMDILDPSNLERLLHFAAMKTGCKTPIDYRLMKTDIKRMISHHESIPLQKYGVTDKMISYIKALVWAEDIETDEEIYAMMRDVQARTKIVLEPHGVTGYIALLRARAKGVVNKNEKAIVFETAHPDKFPVAIHSAGLASAKRKKHSTLARLTKMNLKKMNVPSAIKADLKAVAKAIAKLRD